MAGGPVDRILDLQQRLGRGASNGSGGEGGAIGTRHRLAICFSSPS